MKKNILVIISVLTLLCLTQTASAQQGVVPRDSLLADFDLFIEYLEATHPDPYTPFGGRPYFSLQSQQMRRTILSEPMTKDQFIIMLSGFLSKLHDGHSWIRTATSAPEIEGRVPLYLRAVPGGAVVDIAAQPMEKYLGMRLTAVNGLPIGDIVDKVADLNGCENESDAWNQFCNGCSYLGNYAAIQPTPQGSITFTVCDIHGAEYNFSLPILSASQWSDYNKKTSFKFLPADKRFNVDNLGFRTFECGNKKAMYMRIESIYGRECFKYMHDNRTPGWQNSLESFYDRYITEQMPADTLDAIQRVPAFSERFAEMLSAMKSDKTENLIIDLRKNQGGWTPITLATLYMLFGDRYLTTNMGTCSALRISPLYMQKINSTLDEFNRSNGTSLRMGDYLFNDDNEEQKDKTADIAEIRRNFIDEAMTASRDLLRSLDGKPLYTPAHIYVVTDGGTFSAAFHYAFYLSRMGATVVGTASGQAPNTYMEQTLFKLPRTGIEGQFSNSLQLFLPANDPRAKSFTPDIIFTPEEYASCGWDENAELVLLLRRITQSN